MNRPVHSPGTGGRMKKNLFPLLAIAFIVAVIATGIFYSLLVSRMSARTEAEPSNKGRITAVPLAPEELPNLGIPKGMRAISVQVGDSSGVLRMLKQGHKVDVQAVHSRGGIDHQLKTILENVAVLKVDLSPETAPGKPALPVVTLLATPADANVLGLADAASRIRLTLRNPADQERVGGSSVAFQKVVRDSSTRNSSSTAPRAAAPRPALSPAASQAGCAPQTTQLAPLLQ